LRTLPPHYKVCYGRGRKNHHDLPKRKNHELPDYVTKSMKSRK
jgi:hypothetical protein